MKAKIPFPTAKQHEKMVRYHQRHHAIPGYLNSVQKWLDEIRANPRDIRNTENIKTSARTGEKYEDRTTDLSSIEKSMAEIRKMQKRGDFLLAQSARDGLTSRIAMVNARLTAPAIETGTKQRAALERARSASAEKRHAPVKNRQIEANKIWAKSPQLSKEAVANLIKTKLGIEKELPSSIARRLRKPK